MALATPDRRLRRPVIFKTDVHVQVKDITLIRDINTNDKALRSKGYRNRIELSNAQSLLDTRAYMTANNLKYKDLPGIIDVLENKTDTAERAYDLTAAQLRSVNRQISLLGQYYAKKDIYKAFLQSGNRAAYREEHLEGITAYESARRELNELLAGKPFPTMGELRSRKQQLKEQRQSQYQELQTARDELRTLQRVKKNMDAIMKPSVIGNLKNKKRKVDKIDQFQKTNGKNKHPNNL